MSEDLKNRLRAMTDEQLEEIMRHDLTSDGAELDDEVRAEVIAEWDRRVKDRPEYRVDTASLWEEFSREILPVAKPRRRRRWTAAVRAACLVLAAGLLTTGVVTAIASAAGFDLWGRRAVWSDKIFKYGDQQSLRNVERHIIVNTHTHDAYMVMGSYNMAVPMLPSWYPEGYGYIGTTESETADGRAFDVLYQNDGGDEIAVRVEWHGGEFDYAPEGRVYRTHFTDHFISEDGGETVIRWRIDNSTSVVRGGFSESDAKRMIESVYEFDLEQPNYYASGEQRVVEYREFESVADALAEFDITEPIVPQWIPEGLELGRMRPTPIQIHDEINQLISASWFGEDGEYLSLLIDNGVEPLNISYPKDDGSEVEVITIAGIEHHLIRKDDYLTVVWRNGHNECALGVSAANRDWVEPLLRSIYE